MRILVFGAGSIGSLLGGLLARAHDVTLVGRDPHVSRVAAAGLRIEGIAPTTVRPAAATDAAGREADLAVVTVKAYDADAAGQALAAGTFGAVLPLSNGMGNAERIAARVDCPVLGGTTTYGAVLREPGVVEYRGRGAVTLGARRPEDEGIAERVHAAFEAAGVNATLTSDVQRVLWEKLAVNAGINPVTALAGVRNGALTDDPLRGVASAAARETARAARSVGVDLSDADAVEAISRVARDTAANHSSMYQDLDAGRRTEIDAICGYVVDSAEPAGLSVPVNETLRALIRARESGAE